MIVAELAGWPWSAAMMVSKPVSPSPGTLVWTSLDGGLRDQDRLGLDRLFEHRLGAAPAGGTSFTCRIFSEPALMNCVGSWPTRVSDATNSTAEPPSTRELVMGCAARR